MPFGVNKRLMNESKTSPLKAVSPIIKKYNEHRQKKIKGKFNHDDFVPIQGDGMVGNNIAHEVLAPVQEICAIARLATEKQKIIKPRKRVSAVVQSKKKLLRHGKMMETALEVLKPEAQEASNAKEEAYVLNYFLKVKSMLPAGQFTKFCDLLEELETSGCALSKIFKDLSSLLSSHPELIEDFIPFLTPCQAMECNVFMQHLMLTKMSEFLVLLDTHFNKTPFQTKKIINALEKLSLQPAVTISDISSVIIPMLKGHPVLTDFFLELLPSNRPPDAFQTEFDEIDEEALSEEDEEIWERLDLPPASDPYHGDSCICDCHNSEDIKRKTRAVHCIPCSIKYINGKVFIQSGKLFRRGQITFPNDMEFHRRRLFPSTVEPQKRKRSNSHVFSPTKNHVSSDELKSDDDDKKKTKRGKNVGKRLRSSGDDNDVHSLSDVDNSVHSMAQDKAESDERPWKMNEDRVILQTLQNERYCEETFTKISESLPMRTVSDIKSRFQALLNILYKMKAEAND